LDGGNHPSNSRTLVMIPSVSYGGKEREERRKTPIKKKKGIWKKDASALLRRTPACSGFSMKNCTGGGKESWKRKGRDVIHCHDALLSHPRTSTQRGKRKDPKKGKEKGWVSHLFPSSHSVNGDLRKRKDGGGGEKRGNEAFPFYNFLPGDVNCWWKERGAREKGKKVRCIRRRQLVLGHDGIGGETDRSLQKEERRTELEIGLSLFLSMLLNRNKARKGKRVGRSALFKVKSKEKRKRGERRP